MDSLKDRLRQAMARGYCSPENASKELDATLIDAMAAEVEQVIAPYKEALIWCSGSSSFAPGQPARAGFEKLVLPLITA